jgi:uncharacterized membrane protein YoaK (UPF0700 family)
VRSANSAAQVAPGMVTHLRDAWRTVAPGRDNAHGALPALLTLLTVVTGLVDAFSYLALGHVFVANMTGNVVFLAFGLGGAPGFVWWASLTAIASFMTGAFAGGRLAHAHSGHRGRHLLFAAGSQTLLVLAAFVLTLATHAPYRPGALAPLIVLLGVGMGLQNATARALAVPDLTTTVLTLTITGISADSVPAGGRGSRLGRRSVSIAGMFLGAIAGALLVVHGQGSWVLLAASVLLTAVTVLAPRTVPAGVAPKTA